MQIAGRTFLITGGGSGLGAATARRLAAAGGNVVVVDRQVETGRQTATSLGDQGLFVAADVTDAASVSQALDSGKARFGELHGLVQCAGILGAARVAGQNGPHDLELFTRIVTVNLIGTFNVLRLAAAAMQSNAPQADGERGVIVNTSSVAAFDGQIGQAAYSAAKGGVASLTLPVARELARFGIRVVAIAPGVFATPMVGSMSPAAQESLGAQVPFPARLGEPDEYAQLAEHIITNRMLNGTVIRLDGALRMSAK